MIQCSTNKHICAFMFSFQHINAYLIGEINPKVDLHSHYYSMCMCFRLWFVNYGYFFGQKADSVLEVILMV